MNRISIAIVLAAGLVADSGLAQSGPYLNFQPVQVIVNPVTNRIYARSIIPPKSSVESFDSNTFQFATVALEGTARSFALDPVTNRVYVSVAGPDRVAVIDGSTGTMRTVIGMPASPSDVVVDPSAGQVYVLLEGNQIGIIDVRTNLPVFVPVGAPSGVAAINPSTHKLYVLSVDASHVTVLDGATNVTTVVPLPVTPSLAPNRGIAVNAVTNKVFALADHGRVLSVIDGATNAVTAVPLPAVGHRNLAVNAVTDRIYIANPVPRELTVVDGTTYAITTAPLPSMPAEVAVNETTNTIYVGQINKSDVVVLDGSSLASFVVPIGTSSGNFAIDETRNLVYTTSARNLTVIDAGRANPSLAATFGMAVEFYHGGLEHYVLSSDAPEINRLDNGFAWVRTGQTFGTFLMSEGTTPVCRFYLPPALGDSHLMMANPEECSATATKFPSFIYESPDVFRTGVPNMQTGACAAGLTPVYRLWNQRTDANHRYTVSRAIRDSMVAIGYVAEGYGPDAVSMCAPNALTYTVP